MSVCRLLPAAALAALPLAVLAQTAPAPADTARPARPWPVYRQELGLTVSPQFDNLFTSNRVLPVGLLYQRQLRPGRAWRVRLTGYYSRRDTATAGGGYYIQDKSPTARVWEVNAFVGYEWQHRLGRRWQWHYGLEAGGGYHKEHRDYTNYYHNPVGFGGGGPYTNTNIGFSNLSRWQVQVRGFTGLNYAPTSRMRLFSETAIGVSYWHQASSGSYTTTVDNPNYGVSPGGYYSDKIINILNFIYLPVQILGLSVCF